MKGQLKRNELRTALESNTTSAGPSFLAKSDEAESTEVLSEAFLEDPLFCWVAGLNKDDPAREAKMLAMGRWLHGWINCGIFRGGRGVAMGVRGRDGKMAGSMTVVPSATHKEGIMTTLRTVFRVGAGPMHKSKTKGDYCANSAKRLQQTETLQKRRTTHMKDVNKWIYLQTIGVKSSEQGKGHGKAMLELLNRTAGSLRVPLYLETESKENESLYQHFGYRTLETLDLCVPGDSDRVTMYLMRRDP